jgi:outer membrane protein
MGVTMKRISLVFVCFSLLFCFQYERAWAETVKIGVLNMKRLQQHSVKFQKIREELKEKFNSLQKKLDTERTQISKIEEELQKQSMMLSLDAKEGKEMELGKRTRHYKYMYEEVTQEMKNAEYEATRKVGKEIEKIVEKMAQAEGYTIILEQGTVGLIYYNNAIDITDQVTKAYDATN